MFQTIQTTRDELILRGWLSIPEEGSSKDKPLIVMFHGLLGWCRYPQQEVVAAHLTKCGYTVMCLDFDGHGDSDGDILDMNTTNLLKDADAMISYAESLGIGNGIVLTGHSQGGYTASLWAASNTEKLRRLILLSPAGMVPDQIRSGEFQGNTFTLEAPPERFPIFDGEGYLGGQYLLDAAAYYPYETAPGYTGPVSMIRGTADIHISDDVLRKYEAAYKSRPECEENSVVYDTLPDADHNFLGRENELAEWIRTQIEA